MKRKPQFAHKMPSLYDRMTPDQVQTQIQHNDRLARARIATLVAESKVRRAQTIQSFEFEREAIMHREGLLRQENKKTIESEGRERITALKNENHQKLQQIKRTGHVEREYLLQQYDCEMKARLQVMEQESEVRMQHMAEEHALKMQLLKEESRARLQIIRGDLIHEVCTERPPSRGSMHKVKDLSWLATHQREIGDITGEVKSVLVTVDKDTANSCEPTKDGESALDSPNLAMSLPTPKLRYSEDIGTKLKNTHSRSGRQERFSVSDIDERIRRLKVSTDATPKRDSRIGLAVTEDATIELTDVSPESKRSSNEFLDERPYLHRTHMERIALRRERQKTSHDIMAEAMEQIRQIRATTALKRT